MKKIFVTSIAVLALSCGKMPQASPEEYGKVDFSVSAENYVGETVKSSVSDFSPLPSQSDFNLVINDASGSQIYSGTIKDWSTETAVAAGNYTVSASFSDPEKEGFDSPAFYGETAFVVEGGKLTPVSVEASLSNCIVRLVPGENFSNYYPDWTFTVTTGLGTSISFPKDETRAAFIYPYKFEISGQMTSQGGSVKTFSKEYQPLSPATCYTLSFDVADVAGNSISITFDDTVETVNLADIELNN